MSKAAACSGERCQAEKSAYCISNSGKQTGTSGKTVARRSGFLADLDRFDPYFFGISPREAVFQDPQQRLMLEVAWEAIEDAGVLPPELIGGHAGAIVGICHRDYATLQHGEAKDLGVYTGTGDGSAAAGR